MVNRRRDGAAVKHRGCFDDRKGPPSRYFRALVLAALCVLTVPALAGVPHDPIVARGEHIARLVCSACHIVAVDQEFPPMLTKPAPDFQDLANRPGVTSKSVERFVTHTHWDLDSIPMSMPDPMVNRDEAYAVALYIMSLRKP
jgi:hypothetical protein